MAHSFSKIWIHAIWATKNRENFIHSKIERTIFDIMKNEFESSGCSVEIINGMPDHVHCLFLLNPQKAISEIIKQVKGGSSHEINHKNISSEKFTWQTGFAAYSESEPQQKKVVQYIENQKQHHSSKTFQQEYDEFLKLYGFEYTEKGNG